MRGTATAGQVVGWILVVVGAVLAPVALLSGYDDIAPGMRASVRVASVSNALAALVTGIGFLIASGILVALLDLKDATTADIEARRAAARTISQGGAPPPARHVHPPPATAAPQPEAAKLNWSSQTLPPRIEMVQRHGEAIGGRAWDIIRLGMKDGHVIPEAEAVGKARDEAGAVPRTEEEG